MLHQVFNLQKKHKQMSFNKSKYLAIIFAVLVFSTCDKIEKPYLEENSDKCGNGNLSIPIKKILLEDYTGHTCGNCPRAAEQTELLINTYCDHIIPVSIHVGFFAEPYTSGKYTYDFRTTAGAAWDAEFGNSTAGLPNGLVNRTSYNASKILAYESWAAAIDKLLKEPPAINIEIKNNYNGDTRELETFVDIGFLKSTTNELKLTILLVEDSLVNWQKDYDYDDLTNPGNTDIENYVHRHVLREAINSPWGEIVEGSTKQGEIFSKTVNYILKAEFVAKHCSIVAFVSSSDTKEVIQAEIRELF